MAQASQTVMPAPPAAWGGFQAQPAGAAGAAAHASPQLKRQRPDDEANDPQQQWQQRCSVYGDVQQPPTRRRRLDGGGFAAGAAPVPLPTPQPPAPLPQLQPQAQPSLKRAGSSMSDLELSDAEAGDSQQPPQQRQRTGQPEYRLVLPAAALPPSIPSALLPGAAAPGWSPPLPPAPADAFAVVPWCPPLVPAHEALQQQERQRQEEQGRVRRCLLLGLLGQGCQSWLLLLPQ